MLATTATEFLSVFRDEVDDASIYTAGNDDVCLWKDREIYRYMTAAVDALAKDTDGLFKLVRLPYTASSSVVLLPKYVLHIRHARDITNERDLTPCNTDGVMSTDTSDYGRFDTQNSMFQGTGHVTHYVRDYEKKHLRLVPIPATAGELELQCTVTLQLPMADGLPMPFEDTQDQLLLLEYMKYLAYRKQDAETEDLVRSDKAKAAYDAGAKARKAELRNYRRTPGVVRMQGWNS